MPRRRASGHKPGRRAKKPKRWLSRTTHLPQTGFERELTTKRRGELSELAFALAAGRHGFAVSKPFGDCQRYDIILDPLVEPTNNFRCARPRIIRVQVKSSTQCVNGLYRINSGRRLNGRVAPYMLSEIDFIAAYIIPEDSWFILPLAHVLGQTSLLFRPKKSKMPGLYDSYREAWHYLTDPDGLEIL
jgi:hypothetical protein